MSLRLLASAVIPSMVLFPAATPAQQPWIDAGQYANMQQYNNLIEQQSAPEQEEAAEEARRAKSSRNSQRAIQDERCDKVAVREKLRPEYERRARAEGAKAAQAWLRVKAGEAGRYAAQNC